MEKLKQQAINILMLVKEIQQETGASFENAFKAVELAERIGDINVLSKMFEFAVNEYQSIVAKEEARRAEWMAEAEAAARAQLTAEVERTAEAKPTAEAVPKVAKLPTVKG